MIIVAVAGLAFAAIVSGAWSWLMAVFGIAIGIWLGRAARLPTRVQLILVGSLGGGLGAEIVRTLLFALNGTQNAGSLYRQILIVSLGSAIIVLAAMFIEHLLNKLLSRNS